MSDYLNYRGRCKNECEKLLAAQPELTIVKGWYDCPYWGRQEHWWLKDKDGEIIDPTVKQFPTRGDGAEYIEYAGMYPCEHCGKETKEDALVRDGHHHYCSGECLMRDVGF